MATFTYDFDAKVITIDSPFVTTTAQELLNDIRAVEDNLKNIDDDQIAQAFGKDDLGGGNFTAITLKLINGWTIAAEARAGPSTVQVNISGGNLIAADVFGVVTSPITPTAFTQVVINQSTAPALVETARDAVDLSLDYVESSQTLKVIAHLVRKTPVTDPTAISLELFDELGASVSATPAFPIGGAATPDSEGWYFVSTILDAAIDANTLYRVKTQITDGSGTVTDWHTFNVAG